MGDRQIDGWLDKRIYLETCSGRKFTGKVIDETDERLILIDKFGFKVELNREDIRLLQEEK